MQSTNLVGQENNVDAETKKNLPKEISDNENVVVIKNSKARNENLFEDDLYVWNLLLLEKRGL